MGTDTAQSLYLQKSLWLMNRLEKVKKEGDLLEAIRIV